MAHDLCFENSNQAFKSGTKKRRRTIFGVALDSVHQKSALQLSVFEFLIEDHI
jgi:hypothetical protein